MFTGIVEAKGQVLAVSGAGPGRQLRLRHPAQGRLGDIHLGDSVAVNGVCLTASATDGESLQVDLAVATLERTTLGGLEVGHEVNLEPALKVGDPLGGHLVSGHVDTVVGLVAVESQGECGRLEVEAPPEIRRYLAARGSVCLDGVSLTVAATAEETFSVELIPHTRAVTVAGSYRAGQRVNLEVDMLARYLERLLEERGDS